MVGDNRTNGKQETDSSDDNCKLGPHRTNLHARVSTSWRESAHTLSERGGHRRQRVQPKPLYACRAAFPKTSRPGRSVHDVETSRGSRSITCGIFRAPDSAAACPARRLAGSEPGRRRVCQCPFVAGCPEVAALP